MYSFGKIPPRQLESFGVAGLLGEKCYVFYDNFFSTKNLGRVSDLVAARLAKTGADELRLRTLLLLAIFESHRARSKDVSFSAMSFECGIDAEKIALGVSFTVDAMPPLEGLAARVSTQNAAPGFEELLSELHAKADRVVMRVCPDTREIEILALIAMPGQIDQAVLAQKQALTLVQLTAAQADQEPPTAQSYIQLADLDYDQMLREKPPVAGVTPPTTGEILSLGASEAMQAADATRVAAGPKEGDDKIRIAGGEAPTADGMVRVSGGSGVSGSDPSMVVVPGTEKYVERIKELEARIAELEGGGTGSSSAGVDGAGSGPGLKITELLKNIWPFRRKKGDGEAEADQNGEDPVVGATPEDAPKSEEGAETAQAAASDGASAKGPDSGGKYETARSRRQRMGIDRAAAEAADDLATELDQGQLTKTLARAQREAADIAKDARSKKWVDGLMKELVSEKAGLRDRAQKLTQSIKQKEHEFKNQMHALQEELRRKDEALKQKNAALTRSKDQLTLASQNLEKLKSASGSGGEESSFKQKFNMTSKLLDATKDENQVLKKKLEEMKQKVDAAAVKSRSASTTELANAKTKADRLQRQLDEFKRTNHDLAEKLAEANNAKKSAAVGNADEMKKRLEAAVRMSTVAQKEADQLSLRVEEMQREESRLKKELDRATTELKFLKAGAKPASGGKSSGGSGTPPPGQAA